MTLLRVRPDPFGEVIVDSEGGGSGGGSGVYASVVDHGADPTGVADSTVAFEESLVARSSLIPPGEYFIAGVLNVPLDKDLIGLGAGNVTLRLGPGGQIAHGSRVADTLFRGGVTKGFTVDGDGVSNVAGGGFYVGYCQKRTFEQLVIKNCAGDGTVIETAQNCVFNGIKWDSNLRSNLVFDYGCGGHTFVGCHWSSGGLHGVEFRQSGPSSPGVYPTFLGPSGNAFYGGIVEYSGPDGTSPALVYHGAGGENKFIQTAVSATGAVVDNVGVKMENACTAVLTTATLDDASNEIVVANAEDIQPLMSVRNPNIIPGTIVLGIAGTTITLSSRPLADAVASPIGFGPASTELHFDSCIFPGTDGHSTAFELQGGSKLHIDGRTVFTNHVTAFRTRGNDDIYIHGSTQYYSTTQRWEQVSGDTLVTAEDLVIRADFDGPVNAQSHDVDAPAFSLKKVGNTFPYLRSYFKSIWLSDGTFEPENVGIRYSSAAEDDAVGGIPSLLFGVQQAITGVLKLNGFGGATDKMRFVGRRAASGPPPAGTWRAYDVCLDSGGVWWVCTVAGTPGTWVSPSKPLSWAALTLPILGAVTNFGTPLYDAAATINGDFCELRGVIGSTGAHASGATLFTLPDPNMAPAKTVYIPTILFDTVNHVNTRMVIVGGTAVVKTTDALFANGCLIYLDGLRFSLHN